jgi:hypothetical protein
MGLMSVLVLGGWWGVWWGRSFISPNTSPADPGVGPPANVKSGQQSPRWVWQYEAARKYLDAGDPARAIPLLKDAAEAGHVESITELGQAYYRGRGVMQNYALAVTQFQRAARRGCSEAQYMLGVCYRAGQGVAQDYARAYAWFNLASAQGHPLASQARQELVNTLPPDVIAEGQKISLQISSEADSSDRDVPASP